MIYFFILIGGTTGLLTGFFSCQNHIRGFKNFEAATLAGPTSLVGLSVALLIKNGNIKSDFLIALIGTSIIVSVVSFFVLLILASIYRESPNCIIYRMFYSKIDDLKKLIDESNKAKDIANHQKILLQDLKKEIDDAKENAVCFELPIRERIFVKESFINQIPNIFKNIISFIESMNMFEKHFYKELKLEQLSDKDKKNKFIYLLNNICRCLLENIFNKNDARIHFRYSNKDYYDHLTVYCGIPNEILTRIPLRMESLISKAANARKSLIKSVNAHKEGFHYETKHSDKWPEYATFVFDKFFEDENPLITMGISLVSTQTFKDQLYFMNYCEIENIIQKYLENFDRKIKISYIINYIRRDTENQQALSS